ncbi:PHD transcription factor [Aspergillus piperis CBS 112811]|uniref:PHD transcription factor n=1 Tax=Aspergillus piperis CBS 112811 TaxID=1448313 RepID=A0A8G1VS28_9EURO|nr:PHD transcription factor [Aspergillus piperis CBS 112811]RAH60383.1 PHD transcription factor [Aspergillus piperis CBS 112811]
MAGATQAPGDQTQVDGRVTNQGSTNPYETNPELLPNDDLFLARSVHYGRYAPRESDFKPRYNQWCEPDPEVTSYWEGIVKELCTAENSLNVSGNREVFAAGSVVIRVDREPSTGAAAEKYSCANANELSAARKAEDTLKEMSITVPVIFFCGTIDGKNVTVESRIPGVTLEVAWRYLTAEQIDMFKQQCRRISQRLGGIDAPPDRPSYVCSGLNSQASPDALEPEKNILFRERKEDEHICLVHNNLVPSNVVISDDKVIGITGWRQSGYFGFERADEIHRRFRILVASAIHGDKSTNLRAWSDLYEGLDAAGVVRSASKQDTPIPLVKTEPLNTNLDKVPLNEESESKPPVSSLDGPTADHLTPKNIASLKNRGSSRASSSDRSSPATSTKPGPARKSATAATKKGTGRKSTTKKRKANELDSDIVDGGRSNTPSSIRAGKPATKKRNSTSHTNSPAPDSRRKGSKNVEQDDIEEEEEDDSDDNDEIFCICRKPDNHTWMIGCDGGCEDWFHGKCVNIDPRDADLIDKYICPNCKEQGKGWTTWKPMCRLKECRKPARVNQKIPSKYCSDEHGREFMLQRTKLLLGTGLKAKTNAAGRAATNGINSSGSNSRDGTATPDRRDPDDLGSRGGVLTTGDLKAVVMGVSSAKEFRKLGESIISLPAEEESKNTATTTTDPEAETKEGKKIGLDFDVDWLTYTPDEASKLQKIRKQRDDLLHRKEMLRARNTFMTLVRQRSKSILEHLKQTDPKGGWKDICGFDSRLAWSDEEFDEWRLSEIGAKALEDGSPEALASSYPEAATDADGDTAMDDDNEDDFEKLSRGVCTKKRCERHKQWLKVQQQDAVFEENTLALDLSKCEKEAKNVVERAVLRMWAESDNAQIGGQ